MKLLPFLYLFLTVKLVNGKMESFIMGGEYTTISKYPHSVYLSINCGQTYLCGGSILNQAMVLTAAHCLEECSGSPSELIIVKYGHETLKYMESGIMTNFKLHDRYNRYWLKNDISLVTCKKPIPLGIYTKSVILLRNPPTADYAYVAGWGVVNENRDRTTTLKETSQKMQPRHICKPLSLHKGAFCAGPIKEIGHPLKGDSGSALVIHSRIQIGIVSYKVPMYSLTAYTNVSYYYTWITETSKRLYRA